MSMPCSTPSDGGGAKKKGLPFGGNQCSPFESSGEYRGGGACGGSSSTEGSWHTATGGSGLATNLILDQLPCVLRKFLQVSREIKFSNLEEVTFHIYCCSSSGLSFRHYFVNKRMVDLLILMRFF